MAEGLSQSDLDALFTDITAPAEPKSESFDGMGDILNVLEMPGTDTGIHVDEPGRDAAGNESLSQDQIDELLKQFLG